jgi:hypothetical protein
VRASKRSISIDYRLLADLYRKEQALAVLGWSL